MKLQKNILLSQYTTIRLGGRARYFVVCQSVEEIREVLTFAQKENLPVQILGGGSNTIFSDKGFDGVLLKVGIMGIRVEDRGDFVLVKAGGGEDWDKLVEYCVNRNWSGLESLSGIPGSVGASPIQNIGAYGYEISDWLESLTALDRETLERVEFRKEECEFGYRKSRFKMQDRGKFIIVDVTFRLEKNRVAPIRYEELKKILESEKVSPKKVRETVLQIRKRKSMLLNSDDENTCSVGSFFVNPILSYAEFEAFKKRCSSLFADEINFSIPFYAVESGFKVPAAWLIEAAGFSRGLRECGVGISDNHALALVNCGGTTEDLLNFAEKIEKAVYKKFGISLEKEAIVVA